MKIDQYLLQWHSEGAEAGPEGAAKWGDNVKNGRNKGSSGISQLLGMAKLQSAPGADSR